MDKTHLQRPEISDFLYLGTVLKGKSLHSIRVFIQKTSELNPAAKKQPCFPIQGTWRIDCFLVHFLTRFCTLQVFQPMALEHLFMRLKEIKNPPELTGLEPATPAVTGRCSDQLSYNS